MGYNGLQQLRVKADRADGSHDSLSLSSSTTTMSTFAGSTYNTVKYAAARPTYPTQLFDFIFKFHERSKDAKWNTAVDLGCGTGQQSFSHTFKYLAATIYPCSI